MSKNSIGKKKGRSWSLTSSSASSSSSSFSSSPTPTVTTHASSLIVTPTPSPSSSNPDTNTASPAASPASSPPTDDSPPSPPSPPSPSSTFGRLSSLKRKMARPIQRSYSQSHAHGHQYSMSSNAGLGQGAIVVRTPMDATAHMQHASISIPPSHASSLAHPPPHSHSQSHAVQALQAQSRQKCVQYPHRQSSLRSANGSPMGGASARRPSVGSAAPAQAIPRAPRIEPALEGPAFEEERVEIQLLRGPKAAPRRPYQPGQSVDWSHHAPSAPAAHKAHQSLQFPHQHQQYTQYHAPAAAQSAAQKFQLAHTHAPHPSVSVSPAPLAHGPAGPGLVRSHSSKSSIASPQTPVTPGTPCIPVTRAATPDRPERADSRSAPADALDIDLAYHRHRLTSATGRSSMTITADGHTSLQLAPSSLGHGPVRRLGSRGSLVAPSPTPSAHAHSPSAASFASTIEEEGASPRLPGPMPRRRPSQTYKADGPFAPVVVGHAIRPSTETSTLVTLRFAFSLDTDPNTHTVTVTLDTLRLAGGRLLQFIEDSLRPASVAASSASAASSVYSTAFEAAPDPDMTDGSSESAEDSDFEYDPDPSYRFFQEEYLEVMEEQQRVSPPPRERTRRAPLSSCPTPLPPLAELPARQAPSPAWPSSAGSYSGSGGWGGGASSSGGVSRESSQRSHAPSRKRASTCPSASGVVTELTVLLQRDASSWHAIASRLCSGTWPLLDGRRKRVEAECKWAGMAALAQELSGNPHFQRGYL